MRQIHAAASAAFVAAAIALFGLGLADPAAAAPGGNLPGADPAAAAAPAWAGQAPLILVDDDRRRWRHRDRDDWRDRGHRHRDWDDDWRDRDHRRGHWERDWERDHRRGDWDRHRHREWGWDRGRHRGWDRGRGHDWRWGRGHGRWDDDRWRDRKRWKKDARWRLDHHPYHRRWVGRHFEWRRYDHIRDHARYGLRPPLPGYFYARIDNDIFLVAEGSRRIVDAWVLLGATRR